MSSPAPAPSAKSLNLAPRGDSRRNSDKANVPPSSVASAGASTTKPRASAADTATAAVAPTASANVSTAAVPPKSAVPTAPNKATKSKPTNNSVTTKSPKPCRGTAAACANASKETRKPNSDSSGDALADPELSALRKAEKALFPWALRGVTSEFSFDNWLLDGTATSDEARQESSNWVRNLRLPAIFPNVDGRILTYLDFYRATPEGKSILRVWAKKRGRYASAIVATLAKSGLPTELVWQSLVESGHNPTIKSPAGAAGLWQFMPETARLYGLTVDRWLDERLDPERSTIAAARLMSDLFQRFGNWELALAAYNMGDAGLMRAIRKYNTNDFWALCHYEAGLPMETALYVPRIIALTIAMLNPAAFGIDDVTPDDPIEFDTVTVAPGQLLSVISRLIGVSDEELTKLNPQLLLQRTHPSTSAEKTPVRVNIPRGKAEQFRARIGRLVGLEPDLVTYTLKPGESLEWVANARGVAVDALKSINRIGGDERVESGAVVLVPRQSSEPIESKSVDEERVAVVPPNTLVPEGFRRVFYRVQTGDTLTSIADAFGISRADLLAYNSVDPSARLQPRMLFQVVLPNGAPCKNCTFIEESALTVLVAGTREFSEYFEGLRGNERIVVQAKDKDTLASIGTKYGVSVGTMERINRRSRRDALLPGENVVVYTKRAGNRERIATTR